MLIPLFGITYLLVLTGPEQGISRNLFEALRAFLLSTQVSWTTYLIANRLRVYPIRDSLWHCSIVFSTRKYDRPCVIDLLGGVRVGIFIAAAHLKKAGSVIMSSILVYVFSVYCLECVVVPCDMATLVYIFTFAYFLCCGLLLLSLNQINFHFRHSASKDYSQRSRTESLRCVYATPLSFCSIIQYVVF